MYWQKIHVKRSLKLAIHQQNSTKNFHQHIHALKVPRQVPICIQVTVTLKT